MEVYLSYFTGGWWCSNGMGSKVGGRSRPCLKHPQDSAHSDKHGEESLWCNMSTHPIIRGRQADLEELCIESEGVYLRVFLFPLSHERPPRVHTSPTNGNLTTCVWLFCSEGSIIQCPWLLVLAGFISAHCVAPVKIPHTQEERGVWFQPHCWQSLHAPSRSYHLGNFSAPSKK